MNENKTKVLCELGVNREVDNVRLDVIVDGMVKGNSEPGALVEIKGRVVERIVTKNEEGVTDVRLVVDAEITTTSPPPRRPRFLADCAAAEALRREEPCVETVEGRELVLTPGPATAEAPARAKLDEVLQHLHRLDAATTEAANALTAAGVPEVEEGRCLSLAERIVQLHERLKAWSLVNDLAAGKYGPPARLYEAGVVRDRADCAATVEGSEQIREHGFDAVKAATAQPKLGAEIMGLRATPLES